jgi:hypothetical protein
MTIGLYWGCEGLKSVNRMSSTRAARQSNSKSPRQAFEFWPVVGVVAASLRKMNFYLEQTGSSGRIKTLLYVQFVVTGAQRQVKF